MRKIVSGFACSLDGYIEGPNGEYDWILMSEEVDFAEQMKRYDTYLLGRKTYEMIRKMSGPAMPGVRNYVFSNTLTSVDQNFILVKGDIAQEVIIQTEPCRYALTTHDSLPRNFRQIVRIHFRGVMDHFLQHFYINILKFVYVKTTNTRLMLTKFL